MRSSPTSGRIAIIAHDRDNVATLVDTATQCPSLQNGAPVALGIPFGHKVALADIALGAVVYKYGIVIGQATQDIQRGDHVHVHNLA